MKLTQLLILSGVLLITASVVQAIPTEQTNKKALAVSATEEMKNDYSSTTSNCEWDPRNCHHDYYPRWRPYYYQH